MNNYWEIVLEGSEEAVDEFLDWLPNEHQIFSEGDLALPPEDLSERLRHFIGADSRHRVYLAAGDLAKLEAALRGRTNSSIQLTSRRAATSGRFGFEAEAYSPEVATEIRSALAERAREVEIAGFRVGQEVEESGEGAALYSPVHEFEFRTEGLLSGPIPELLATRTRLAEIDFVHLGPLEITS